MSPRLALGGAAALLAIGNSAHAEFFLGAMNVLPNESIEPSSGSFVTQNAVPNDEGAFLVNNITIDNARPVWRDSFDTVMSSTWLDIDPYGPKGQDGSAEYGKGWFTAANGPPQGSSPIHIPTYNHNLASPASGLAVNGANGDPVNGDGLSPGIYGAATGLAWTSGPDALFRARSASSSVNGISYDSLHLGHFVLSDPNASLLGNDLFLNLRFTFYADQSFFLLPLDGSAGQTASDYGIPLGGATAFRLEYERTTFTNSLGTFTALDMYLVPAPATALAPLAALVALRRRRR